MKTIKANNIWDIPKNYTGIVEFFDREKHWYLNGTRHRTDGPAIEDPNGTKAWYLNGVLHRTDGPCTTCKDCLEGNFELCSKPGPAIEYPNGSKHWCLNGKLHRIDGPAVGHPNGEKKWWLNGELHRENGPAIEHPNGIKEYWFNGEPLNKNKINQFIEEFDYPVETAIKLTYWLKTKQ